MTKRRMKKNKKTLAKMGLSRRMFLRGAGGFALAIPFLPSLLPRRAWGAEPQVGSKRMICMTTNHGGVWQEHMYPAESTLMSSQAIYGGHDMHWGPLTVGNNSICPVLTAPSLTQNLANKMMVLRGLDVPFYIAHHTGGYLGNYARNDGNGAEGQGLEHRPTIDQVMAWSPSFYPDIGSITKRSIHIGRNQQQGISWGWSSPSTASGDIQNVPTEYSSMGLFNDIYVPDTPPSQQRPPVVDLVLQHYNQLHGGAFGAAGRMSVADRQKLTDYMDRLDELERKLNVVSASCGDVSTPTQDATVGDSGFGGWVDDELNEDAVTCDLAVIRDWYHLYNDVLVAAMTCDTSRLITIHASQTFSTSCNYNAWHQNVAHVANVDAEKEEKLWNSKRWFFENVFMDLVTKMDAVPDVGGSILDNSLVWWTQESGVNTHESDSMPIIAAGSAGGFFQTGMMYDYRQRDNQPGLVPPWEDTYAGLQRMPGLTWNQWLGTVLQSMGVPPSEWEVGDVKGYGIMQNTRPDAYPDYVINNASEVLPNITS